MTACRFGPAGPAAPNTAFAQLAKRHGNQIGCRLHDARVFIAQTPGQIALNLERVAVRNVELEVRHCGEARLIWTAVYRHRQSRPERINDMDLHSPDNPQ